MSAADRRSVPVVALAYEQALWIDRAVTSALPHGVFDHRLNDRITKARLEMYR